MSEIKRKTASGFVYRFAERIGAQGISFVISMILARILLPEEYGVVALVTVFIALLDVFVTDGFGSSLVVNKKADSLDFSTCFYFGICFSAVIYAAVYFSAPYIAAFYENELLIPVIRVMGLRIPIASVNTIQHAYVSKHMIFKKFFYATLIGTVVSGVIAVVMAYLGFGVWALVMQYLGNIIIDTLCLWITVKWRPTWEFSFVRLKAIYTYGWKILLVGLIDTLYREIRSLVIGKKYSSADLAYYNKGMQFPIFGNKLYEPTVKSVLFPALSNCNDDVNHMLSITRRILKLSTFILAPIMVGMAVVAKPLILVVLTEKWMPAVIYLQIGCVAYLFRPLATINNNVIKASGNSTLLLKLDIIKKSIGISMLIVSMFFGVEWIAVSYALTSIISACINVAPNKKILGYGYKAQIMDILPNFAIALMMGILVWGLTLLNIHPMLMLPLQVFTGMAVYIGLAKVFKIDSFTYLLAAIRQYAKTVKKARA